MSSLTRLLNRFVVLTVVLAVYISGCSTSEPNYAIVKIVDSKILTGSVCSEVYISVKEPLSKVRLESLLNKILKSMYNRDTPLGRSEAFIIKAYYDTDPKRIIGTLYQASSAGRIAFQYNNEVTYDRELEKPLLSPEEKARQDEVGRFARDLMKEADKIRSGNQ